MNILSLKKVVAQALCHPTMGKVISTCLGHQISINGCAIDTKNDQVTRQTIARLFWGMYESNERRFISQYLRRDLDVIELGSCLGVVSSIIAVQQDRAQQLICVEANPFLVDTIKKNVTTNAPWKQLSVLNRAIDYTGQSQATFVLDRLVNSRVGRLDDTTQVTEVPTSTLAEIVALLYGRDYTLVTDIEGAEAGFIVHGERDLTRCQQIICELHDTDYEGRSYTVEKLRKLLETQHGFTVRDSYGPVFVFEKP